MFFLFVLFVHSFTLYVHTLKLFVLSCSNLLTSMFFLLEFYILSCWIFCSLYLSYMFIFLGLYVLTLCIIFFSNICICVSLIFVYVYLSLIFICFIFIIMLLFWLNFLNIQKWERWQRKKTSKDSQTTGCLLFSIFGQVSRLVQKSGHNASKPSRLCLKWSGQQVFSLISRKNNLKFKFLYFLLIYFLFVVRFFILMDTTTSIERTWKHWLMKRKWLTVWLIHGQSI